MTLLELLGGVAGAIGAGVGTYRAVSSKVDSVVGKKEDDNTLRDLVMKIDGKIDAHQETNAQQFKAIGDRLVRVEQRVFTPPSALRVVAPGGKPE